MFIFLSSVHGDSTKTPIFWARKQISIYIKEFRISKAYYFATMAFNQQSVQQNIVERLHIFENEATHLCIHYTIRERNERNLECILNWRKKEMPFLFSALNAKSSELNKGKISGFVSALKGNGCDRCFPFCGYLEISELRDTLPMEFLEHWFWDIHPCAKIQEYASPL